MAFGFGFNKQKVLSAAEKFVQQGKLTNAISEYEKILKHDTKDLTVMNTIGDLHARLGESDKAVQCFKNVGDAYATQGFTVKAIAMYKKLSKLKPSVECVLRLAELYTQQGLFNDARAQYLQVAEEFLKTGQLDQAVRIFEKTLEMDPENVPMRSKLAEVYVKLGKKQEAWQILSAAAESLKAKGQLAAADEILKRMLKLEPGSSYALLMRGKAALESGNAAGAVDALSKVPDLDTNPDGMRALFQGYLRTKAFAEAGTVATKLANIHDDNVTLFEYADALMTAQRYAEAAKHYGEYSDRLLRQDSGRLLESLRSLIGYVKDDTEALETVLSLFQKAGETAHLAEIYELLAHGYVQAEELTKARDYYQKLMQLEPENQMHARSYQQVQEKLGASSGPQMISAEEGAVLVDELEATAPVVEQRYDDEIALAVKSAITDAELFLSYNMAPKAVDPLLQALRKAPRDLRVNQKLAALHTRAGKFAEAAACCRTLEGIYHDAGHAEEASRYGDLASKYEQRSGTTRAASKTDAPMVAETAVRSHQEFEISAPAPEFSAEPELMTHAQAAPAVEPAKTEKRAPGRSGLFFHAPTAPPVVAKGEPPVAAAPVEEPEAAAVDVSSEWESDFSVETHEAAPEPTGAQPEAVEDPSGVAAAGAKFEAPDSAKLDEGIEEVRFYLGQGMVDYADRALAKLEGSAPPSPELVVLRHAVESARQHTIELEPEKVAEEVAAEEQAPAPAAASVPQPWPQQAPAHMVSPLEDIVSDLEASLGEGFGHEPQAGDHAAAAPQEAHASAAFHPGTLDEFVSDLEASLGNDFLPEASAAAPVAQPQVAHTAQTDASAEHARAWRPAPAAQSASPTPRAAAASASAGASAVAPVPPTVPAAPPIPAPSAGKGEAVAGVDLSEMFGELKSELEEGAGSADEDPETHYNLGVAFREMGLLDEAAGEFQKVCKAVERGHSFPQLMQTYTWLAQCFLDKGVPEAAVRWYEKALSLPSLDQETRTALHYELASSFETAGNRPAALNNFLEVYSSNIDYRDVAERIKALKS
jgi:tetratricopeptide (TPR) repeat protein